MSQSLIPDAAVKAIQDSVATEVIAVDELNYLTRDVFLPPAEIKADCLRINTLAGIVDFLKNNIDSVPLAELAIHIVDHEDVRVVSKLTGRDKSRDLYVHAQRESVLGNFRFGTFYDPESFNIALQTVFKAEENRAKVLQLVGTLKDEKVTTAEDDGVTQVVTARAGVARVAEVQVPNPVTLYPFRTFREVDQPGSPFILRMQRASKEGELPKSALFEADGGLWKLDAIANIKRWLELELTLAEVSVAIIA